jgi:sorbitol-specific phosphotransferase system component IIBC
MAVTVPTISWVLGVGPVVASLVKVRVADTAMGDFKSDFALPDFFTIENNGDQILVLRLCSESVNFDGFFSHA